MSQGLAAMVEVSLSDNRAGQREDRLQGADISAAIHVHGPAPTKRVGRWRCIKHLCETNGEDQTFEVEDVFF
jgi:hypothetical protein